MQEGGFSGAAGAVKGDVPRPGKIYRQGPLLLGIDIVDHAQRCGRQTPAACGNGGQQDLFGQNIQPQRVDRKAFFMAQCRQLGDHSFQLGLVGLFGHVQFCGVYWIGSVIGHLDGDFVIGHIGPRGGVFGAAVSRLDALINFIVPHLQVHPARIFNHGCVRLVQHVGAVLFVCHPQADFEVGVAHNLGVHNAGRLLGGQNQVNAQAAAHLGHVDQLGQKFWLLGLELGKLIHNDNQMGQRFAEPPGFIVFVVRVNVDFVHTQRAGGLVEADLAGVDFCLQGDQRTVEDAARQVGNGGGQMGQARRILFGHKGPRHVAALEIHQNKGHFFGAEMNGQGQHKGLKKFALARTAGAGHQAVAPVVILMDIQAEYFAAGHHTDGRSQRFGRIVIIPVSFNIQIFYIARFVHLQEGNAIHNAQASGIIPDGKLRQSPGKVLYPVDLQGI